MSGVKLPLLVLLPKSAEIRFVLPMDIEIQSVFAIVSGNYSGINIIKLHSNYT